MDPLSDIRKSHRMQIYHTRLITFLSQVSYNFILGLSIDYNQNINQNKSLVYYAY